MKNISAIIALSTAIAVSFSAGADQYADAALALCEKVKACALAQMGDQDLTPEIRQMVKPMLDGMCAQVQQQMPQVGLDHELYKPALACMKSLAAVGCDSMQTAEHETPACQEYERLSSQ